MSSTSGPALSEYGTTNIGVGAHIAAASLGRPRYDVNMKSAERSSGANGIWLCQSCSKLIDSDKDRYTVPLLHQWKNDAVQRARDATVSGRPLGALRASTTADEADEQFLRGLNLPSSDAVDAVVGRLRAASRTDIAAFRAARGRPTRTLSLTLRLDRSAAPNATLDGVSRLMALAEPVSIVAPGGMGKSTTMVQLAECMLEDEGTVPLLVPLGEWSDGDDDFFDYILRRNAFGSFRRQHFMQLAYHRRLALLLDGWNELTPEARLRATRHINALQRDYPLLGLAITSRLPAPPVSGPTIAIEQLSLDQQLELARAVRGQDGESLVDRAWRTGGISELLGIPLYLSALLTLPSGADFPETKEAVLRMFAEQNELAADKIEVLERDTVGQYTTMLVGLAVEANRGANTVISDSNANRTISSIVQRLSAEGQIGAAPQPRDIVNSLVGAHLLVRSAGIDGAVSFQHQLFQEWYAADEVEKVMLKAAAGEAEARNRLREDILNWPSWEESILFACDRLSRANATGARAVAAAVQEALGIDPLLAGTMLDRATDAVWLLVRDRVLRFVGRWHKPGTVDRAVRFMIASGKPEFASRIWPLASNANDQIQFETFRACDRFRTSVLGREREALLRALPAPQRKVALCEIAITGGFDGMELTATLASDDPDPVIVVSVVESLASRRGQRHVNRIMQRAPDAVWKALGRGSYPEHFTDPQLNERLAVERQAALEAEVEPIRLLARLVSEKPADAEPRITSLLANNDVAVEQAVALAFPEFPRSVASGLIARIASDLPLPYRTRDYLKDAVIIDSGPVANAVLDPSTSQLRLIAAAAVVGPATVSALFDELLAIDNQAEALGRYDQGMWNTRWRLEGAISATRQDVFLPELMARVQTSSPRRIGLMASLFARHGYDNEGSRPPIYLAHRLPLRAVVDAWIATLLAEPKTVRNASLEVARAAERLADASLADSVRLLLERDLNDCESARAAYLAAGRRGQMPPDAAIVNSRSYASAFAAMHDAPAVAVLTSGLSDLRWGADAAGGLFQLWSADHPVEEKRPFSGWADFYGHVSRREERDAGTPATSIFAESIFTVVRALGNATNSDEERRHAFALAVTGLGLPHGDKRREIAALLRLPQPIASKHRLLVAAAYAGEVIEAALLMEGLRDLLEAAQTQTWRLDERHGELMGWIELFPFSDGPEKVLDAIAMLPAPHQQPHTLRRLLQTLPQGPAGPALTTIERLAAKNPAFLQEFEWMNALTQLDTEAAALAWLDWLCDWRVPLRDDFRLSRTVTEWARRSSAVRAAMIARYRALPAQKIRMVLEMAMGHLTDEEVFMALFDGQVDAPQSFQSLARAIRNLAIGNKPSTELHGALDEFGVPLTSLRSRLFAMLPGNDRRASLAKQCLIAIEEHRDDRGRPSGEPRHPDIATGGAWPPEAAELSSSST